MLIGPDFSAGTYLIFAKVTMDIDDYQDDSFLVQCRIDIVGKTGLDQSSFWDKSSSGENDYIPLNMMATVTVAATNHATIVCQDNGAANADWRDAKLYAVKVA